MASVGYNEPLDLLSEETRNLHRAIVSLMEELEAIDWYTQRAEACSDPQLREVITHNKNEEIEHAMMALEWIRRHQGHFDAMMKKYLFTEQPITGIEGGAGKTISGTAGDTLGIGSLKGR
jgi:ferritin-like protein